MYFTRLRGSCVYIQQSSTLYVDRWGLRRIVAHARPPMGAGRNSSTSAGSGWRVTIEQCKYRVGSSPRHSGCSGRCGHGLRLSHELCVICRWRWLPLWSRVSSAAACFLTHVRGMRTNRAVAPPSLLEKLHAREQGQLQLWSATKPPSGLPPHAAAAAVGTAPHRARAVGAAGREAGSSAPFRGTHMEGDHLPARMFAKNQVGGAALHQQLLI